MKISIIIPVYNEARTIKQVVDNVLALSFDKEVILVDDGSTDSTLDILMQIKKEHLLTVRVICLPMNQGKGAALRAGIKHSCGQVIVFQDADLEYDPKDIPAIIAPILSGQTNVCFGSRMSSRGFLSSAHRGINRLLSVLTSNVTDMETGMKAFEARTIKRLDLVSTGFEIEPEITIKLLNNGEEIYEVPISYQARTKQEGKKIGPLDGVKALFVIGKLRLKYACAS